MCPFVPRQLKNKNQLDFPCFKMPSASSLYSTSSIKECGISGFQFDSDSTITLSCNAKFANEPKSLYEYSAPSSSSTHLSSSSETPSSLYRSESAYIAPPPPYQCRSEPKSQSPSTLKWGSSVLAWLFRPKIKSPPPYVGPEELKLIEARLNALDPFFGGAAL